MMGKGFVFVSAVLLSAASVSGQQPTQQPAMEQVTVADGHTIWGLAAQRCGDGFRWREIFDVNVREGRLTQDRLTFNEAGEPVVLIRPGENILAPTEGCSPAPAEPSAAAPPVVSVNPDSASVAPTTVQADTQRQGEADWHWPVIILAVLLLAAAALVISARNKRVAELEAALAAQQPPEGFRRITIDAGEGKVVVNANGIKQAYMGEGVNVGVSPDNEEVYIHEPDTEECTLIGPNGEVNRRSKQDLFRASAG